MSSINVFIPKLTRLDRVLKPLLSMSTNAGAKDREGHYLVCNQFIADAVGQASVKDVLERTDFDLSWKENAEIYRNNDQQVDKYQKSRFFIESGRNSKNEFIDYLSIKTSLHEFIDSTSGTIGISIPLNQASFTIILSQFLEASEKINLNLDPRLMIRIVTQAMQLNNAHTQWKHETELFDYETVKFSLREAQCLHYFLNNYSAEKTAEKLHISRKTVETHLARIKDKLQCKDKSQITNKAIDLGFIDLMFMIFP